MPTSKRDLERSPRLTLPANLGQIGMFTHGWTVVEVGGPADGIAGEIDLGFDG